MTISSGGEAGPGDTCGCTGTSPCCVGSPVTVTAVTTEGSAAADSIGAPASMRRGSAPASQRPSCVMPMGTMSYFSGSSARITDAAEATDTSCSPERPPKMTPTCSLLFMPGTLLSHRGRVCSARVRPPLSCRYGRQLCLRDRCRRAKLVRRGRARHEGKVERGGEAARQSLRRLGERCRAAQQTAEGGRALAQVRRQGRAVVLGREPQVARDARDVAEERQRAVLQHAASGTRLRAADQLLCPCGDFVGGGRLETRAPRGVYAARLHRIHDSLDAQKCQPDHEPLAELAIGVEHGALSARVIGPAAEPRRYLTWMH